MPFRFLDNRTIQEMEASKRWLARHYLLQLAAYACIAFIVLALTEG